MTEEDISADNIFLTRQNRVPTTFEIKYLEKFGQKGDTRIGLPGLSPELVDKNAEMEQIDKELEEARLKFETWKTNLQVKKKEIEVKKEKLADQKRQLDMFTVVHTAELKKCKEREKSENQQIAKMESELEQLTIKEKELKLQNEKLVAELQKLQPCADYLQNVVTKSIFTFDNIEAILNRYSVLSVTRAEYLETYQQLLAQMGIKEREAEKQLLHEKNLLIDATMKYNDGIMNIEQVKKNNEYEKAKAIKQVQRVEEKNVELAMIKTSINAIYQRAVEKAIGHNETVKPKEGVSMEDLKLQYIQNRFTDLQIVIDEWKKEGH
ncbi:hypothetical protein TVAG_159800 [Trichomonas vaginalis G3]|uniref:DUF4200 domain-containing protein n=1 Tax=Trichomonas vaginalis (strain ATCC PRA-98 / G3) TaxID=412133 RepID=A2DUS2_TRIV3|nr:DUF4200 domain family [Trichomonas vaginalis G3]EAY15807.1 hypothetical protein TVAG_159800 [Trichomonas vaginalis G3]KAI5525022.1 DUF4200 domain family [Trichomonas vaginalis G3]|eukprot:XP_001328030.1 hypothetical protein [Trichomonas vaginalis G3]